ncbi:3'-5' exoribonuclease 1-like isoform X1 [Schistocerca piceifrons]|uniref:3'-5' exoribonuclease 1-like isoform X1 n=1 Tax=Schistocerca piceifrons TaxID=274613 RepID=UPI001F5F831B|nr:3'-5' exoribonuclease 1-like isoform X1 [Schistocerca piceifrons]XP_049814404.1 3'-5' exoribonuclease 1-like isoform X1 [Schistocerca nitens]
MANSTKASKADDAKEPIPKTLGSSPYSDAVYHELSRLNGQVNRMNKQTLIQKMRSLRLSTEGSTDVLKKRLKNYYKKRKLATINVTSSHKLYPYYVIVDFEATCEEVNPPDYPHEIIEFPAVLVNSEKQEIEDCFQSYCRPTVKSTLSKFCTELTGITQEQVDKAETFPEVLSRFEAWLVKHGLGTKYKYAIVTDGPWDMGRFLYGQCQLSGIPYPSFGKKWINIRKTFSNFYKSKRYCLKMMIDHLEIGFEGRPHCGIDDARNIARVLIHLIADGANVHINERIHLTAGHNKMKVVTEDGNQSERRVLSVKETEAAKDTMKWQVTAKFLEKTKDLNSVECEDTTGEEIADLSTDFSTCHISQSSDDCSS